MEKIKKEEKIQKFSFSRERILELLHQSEMNEESEILLREKRNKAGWSKKIVLPDDARRESCAREEQTQRDREQCTRLIRAASSVKREGERKEKREKGKKKLSLESIAFIIRESRDNEKATRVFTRVH